MSSSRNPDRAEVMSVLSRPPMFRGLPGGDLESIADIALPRSFRKGESLFVEGQPSSGFWVVLSGSLKLFKLSFAGKEQILHVHGPGETFAEATLPEGARYPASAQALEDCRVLLVPRADFQRLLGRRPALATNLIARLSQRIRQMVALVEDLSLHEAPGRLARYLLELAGEDVEAGFVVRIPMKKGELASLLGTRQETLSRVFRKLSDARVIEVRGPDVKLVDPDRLLDAAEG